MKKKIKNNQEIFMWAIWLALVIFWNFFYPEAEPIYDVIIATALSLIFILIKKIK